MSDLLSPVYMITGIAISQVVIEWLIFRRVNWFFPSIALGLWGVLGFLEIANRLGWLPKPKSPEDWLYENDPEHWVLYYATFGAFWDMNEKGFKENGDSQIMEETTN